MSNEHEPYARVYYAKLQREFPEVWRDDALLAAWTRLHSVADASWPMHPPLPRAIRTRTLARLVEVGIVLTDGDTYTTRGLDAERTARSDAARNAAAKRWHSEGNAGAMPSRTEPSKAEQSQADQPARDPADIYWSLTGRYPTDKVLKWLDDLTAQYGADPTIRAIADAHIADRSTATLLGRAQDILRAGARQLDRRERAATEARIAEQRAKPKSEEPWKVEYRKAIEDHYRNLEEVA